MGTKILDEIKFHENKLDYLIYEIYGLNDKEIQFLEKVISEK